MTKKIFTNAALLFSSTVPHGKVGWESPSNIALVKYWGKKKGQIPQNPSLSFTLKESFTKTVIEYSPAVSEIFSVSFYLDGARNKKFESRIAAYLDSISDVLPFLNQLDLKINSKNTFPHSAGIASSAAGMSALALCLCSIEKEYFGTLITEQDFFEKASYLSRLGSGSAARSLYGGLVSWGEIDGHPETSDLWGTQQSDKVHPDFLSYRDSIIIVDASQKKTSSSVGHGLMNSNPFSLQRFQQAQENIQSLIKAMQEGDFEKFINITESEALTLHAMMMTSNPYYLLLKPNTLQIIDRIFEFRKSTGIPVCFTLDAGPNVHLLYPEKVESEVKFFIKDQLMQFIHKQMIIEDRVGEGPVELDL